MKVYIVLENTDYNYWKIQHIYKTKNQAENFINQLPNRYKEYYAIEEHQIED